MIPTRPARTARRHGAPEPAASPSPAPARAGSPHGATARGRAPGVATLLCAVALAGCTGGGSGDSVGSGGISVPGAPGGPGAPGSSGSSGGSGGSGDDADASGAGGVVDARCSVASMNRTVDRHLRDYYLFADRVPDVDPDAYDSPEALLEALRIDPPDRFSYIGDAGLTSAFFEEGVEFGYGWLIERDPAGRAVLALVKPGSPLELAGVVRGETLLSIDGTALDELLASGRAQQVLGTGREARTVELGLEGVDGTERTVSVTRGEFDVRAVVDVRALEPAGPGGPKVGYLHFQSFVGTASEELDAAFSYLAGEGVDELVLDLRYNGGGRIDVARELASRIVGDAALGRDFARYRLNERYQGAYEAAGRADELAVPFAAFPDALDLPRVHVIATDRTCSASEMVINGLEPFVDVVTVGGRSCGKPFGFSGREFCSKVLNAVEFEFVNDAGVGGYADGIAPDCRATDDTSRSLGDPAEGMLSAALAHVADGACAAILADASADGGVIAARERDAPLSEPTNPYRDELTPR